MKWCQSADHNDEDVDEFDEESTKRNNHENKYPTGSSITKFLQPSPVQLDFDVMLFFEAELSSDYLLKLQKRFYKTTDNPKPTPRNGKLLVQAFDGRLNFSLGVF